MSRRILIFAWLAIFVLGLGLLPAAAQAAGAQSAEPQSAGPQSAGAGDPADAVLGLWRTEPTDQGHAHVSIRREGGRFLGEIVALSKPNFPASEGPEWEGKPKVDRNNPDADARDRPIIGLEIVWGFTHKGDGRWEGGRVYDPENGKTYKAKMRLQDDGTLDVRGFIGFSLLGRTTAWQRVTDDGASGDD